MIDMIVLVSVHALLALAGYQLLMRDDLDEDPLLTDEEPSSREKPGP